MRPLCLLFDSDGTLVDSEPLLDRCLADVLPAYGLPYASGDYLRDFRGLRFQRIIRTLEQHHRTLSPARREQLEADVRRRLGQRIADELQPIPGIPEVLTAVASHPCAVVSNGPANKVRSALAATGLAHHFGERIFSAYDYDCWKPDPGLYLAAARTLGFEPTDCVVIEDTAVGASAGLAAGMRVLHLRHDSNGEASPAGAISVARAADLVEQVASMQRDRT